MISRTVQIGAGHVKQIGIGGLSPVSIQTMWKEGILVVLKESKEYNKDALFSILERIAVLESLGCDLLRFAVPDMESARALNLIASKTSMPLVADIHFDYRLALECLKGDVAKIRINPGNIGKKENLVQVVEACKDKNVGIRIGVNFGSLPKDLLARLEEPGDKKSDTNEDAEPFNVENALVEAAERECAVLENLGFYNYLVSMKASNVRETIAANELFASRNNIPLHLGVTEAGPMIPGIVKSTIAFTHLLSKGIGNTLRVSLSDSPENEVICAREILSENGLRMGGVKIVSCPRCGRNGFDVHAFVNKWQNELLGLDKNLQIAVMGCVVNGPGEARTADLGITGAGDRVLIFKKGEIVHTIRSDESIKDENERLKKMNSDADTLFRKELYSF